MRAKQAEPRGARIGTWLGTRLFMSSGNPATRWRYTLAALAFTGAGLLVWLEFETSANQACFVLALLTLAIATGYALGVREEGLQSLCAIDPLTGLYNRRHFELALKHELAGLARHEEPLALLVLDLDALKLINDQQGHNAGDAAIRAVGDALRATCRTSDVCARWGGDEFVVLAPRTDQGEAETLAERISKAVEQRSEIANADARLHSQPSAPRVTVSVGWAIASVDRPRSLWPASLFAAADRAMYRRKDGQTRVRPLRLATAEPPQQLNPRLARIRKETK